MDTQLISSWATFDKLSYLEKRAYFRVLVAENLYIQCEARLYRVLTRLTFQSLRRKNELHYQLTKDEELLDNLLQKIGLSASTCNNWFYSTLKQKPLELVENDCKDNPTGAICDCCVDPSLREKLRQNYDFQLVSKRIYRTLVNVELFKAHLLKEKIILSDDEIRKSLRRLVEEKYYSARHKNRLELRASDISLKEVLCERKIGAMAVLNWFYLLKNHPELLLKIRADKL